MIHGTFTVGRVKETSACQLAEDARLDTHKEYKVYSAAITPNIKPGKAQSLPDDIDGTRIRNGSSTKVSIKNSVSSQNYILAKYVGTIPYDERYKEDPEYKTPAGTKFTLTCQDGNPNQATFQ